MPTLDILTHTRRGFFMMHLAGFELYRRELLRDLGLETRVVEYAGREGLRRGLGECRGDAAMVVTDWSWTTEELAGAFRGARGSGRKLVYFDCFDQTSTPYLGLLPDVDLYLKAKMLAPRGAYLREYRGGYVVTDALAKGGMDLSGWTFGSVADPAYLDRLEPGWSFGYSRRIRWLLRFNRLAPHPWRLRDLDLHARFSPPQRDNQEWYEQYRARAFDAAERLRGAMRVTPPQRVSMRKYYLEMRRCRMVFSPFGWGELCLRDYEAAAAGCVLLKPDMGHVRTSPDIFEAGVTYAPVAWDFSDLERVCEGLRSRPEEARSIAAAGQQRLAAALEGGGFVRDVGRVLGRLGLKAHR